VECPAALDKVCTKWVYVQRVRFMLGAHRSRSSHGIGALGRPNLPYRDFHGHEEPQSDRGMSEDAPKNADFTQVPEQSRKQHPMLIKTENTETLPGAPSEPVTEGKRQRASSAEEATRLRRMFDEHGAFVCRSLRMLGVPEGDLDDALQEVFLVVFQRMRDYEERGRVRAWLYSICTRVVWTRRRVVRRRREDLGAEIPEAITPPTQHDRVVDHEALALGHRLLQGLPAEQRDVFWLYEVEELPMSEIARSLNCPLQTAYSRLHKARERILVAVQQNAAKDPDHV